MKTKNRYRYPIERKHIQRITYRASPAHVGPLRHSVDFIVPEGIPVKAAAGGVVVDIKDTFSIGGSSKKKEGYGNYVEIKHRHGEYSEYEHLRKGIPVKVGQRVRKGQIIGFSGATGWLAHLGPHLHFMVGVYGTTDKDYETLRIVWEKP